MLQLHGHDAAKDSAWGVGQWGWRVPLNPPGPPLNPPYRWRIKTVEGSCGTPCRDAPWRVRKCHAEIKEIKEILSRCHIASNEISFISVLSV